MVAGYLVIMAIISVEMNVEWRVKTVALALLITVLATMMVAGHI
jgi:hypothetical protein